VEAVRQAQLPDAARLALRHALEQLDQRAAVCASDRERLRGESIVALKGLQERHLDPEEPLLMERLIGLCTEAEQVRSELERRVGEIHAQLDQDQQACERRSSIIANQVQQRASRDRADRLRQLIGSADGSRFSRYAQALTLDLLIEYANHRLLTLAPRYHLRREPDVRDGEPSLALRVIDHDQADTERSISTLSGGETFLASLALALALADLNRGRLKVETLCIDEGFGTLDEQTLAQAMATLERLQVSQGTQILLISHIGALHERIAHRIEVVRRGGGASWVRLVGPDGVSTHMPVLPPVGDSDAADQTARDVLLGAIRDNGSISSVEGQDLIRRDAGGVRSLLKGLIDDGQVVMEGRGKGVRYRMATAAHGFEKPIETT
jgi:exonuclease SbcC